MTHPSHPLHAALATVTNLLLILHLTGCGGGGGGDAPTAPPTPPASGLDDAARSAAATSTAQNSANACASIQPFYWEIGDKTRRLAGASVAKAGSSTVYDADTAMPIASASKWLYGAYVVERRAGAVTAEDVQYLNFQSGYTNFGFAGCEPGDTVASCVARADNGLQSPGNVGKFFYNGGHMQKHASLAAPGMAIGALDNTGLATEIRRVLGTDIALSYTQPQLAGGVRSSANGYAAYLRRLLAGQLKMSEQLGSHPVCTNPATCASAIYTPITTGVNWHYSLGHWVEDDASSGDSAFSSPGAFGFYPWVDATKTYYGIVARVDSAGGGNDSAVCGALIRRAWVTGVAR